MAACLLAIGAAGLAGAGSLEDPTTGGSAEVLRRGAWVAHAVAPLPAAAPGAPVYPRTRYGGVLAGGHEGTGFFRVEKDGGRWRLIDPDGGRFVSRGLNSVHARDLRAHRENQGIEAPVDPEAWAREVRGLLLEAGFNTLGAWSADGLFREEGLRLPYTRVLNLASSFGYAIGVAHPKFGHTGFAHEVVPVFHRDFAAHCMRRAAELTAATRDDPWLIGYFSDNELPFRTENLVARHLLYPEDDDNHREARRWLEQRHGRFSPDDVTEADDAAFAVHVFETYFRIVGEAIRAADPDHMVLGSRFHGMAMRNEDLFRAAGPHVDVISVNYYHRWDVEQERLARWEELTGRPLLVTEFYARRIPGTEMDGPGAGFRVRHNRDRGLFYQHFTLGLAEAPSCVGWHWHRYSDYASAAAGITQGIVTAAGEPHAEVLDLMRRTHQALDR